MAEEPAEEGDAEAAARLAYECAEDGGGLELFIKRVRTRHVAVIRRAVSLASTAHDDTGDDLWAAAERLLRRALGSGFFGSR